MQLIIRLYSVMVVGVSSMHMTHTYVMDRNELMQQVNLSTLVILVTY